MDLIKTTCSGCGNSLEFPVEIANVICTTCGTSYVVHQYEGTISLSVAEPQAPRDSQVIDDELTAINEHIDDVSAEIEAIRSKEQAIPLQKGCALFGIFFLGVLVIVFFMTLGINYFGRWPFYLSMAIVVGLGLLRMKRRLATLDEIESLRRRRAQYEDDLRVLGDERSRLQDLKEALRSDKNPSLIDPAAVRPRTPQNEG
jgi:hypothetical protein